MGTKLHVTYDDAYGRTTSRVYGMEEETTLAQMQTDAAEFLTAMEAATDLGCVKATISFEVTSPEWDEIALASVDRGGTFSGWITAGQKKGVFQDSRYQVVACGCRRQHCRCWRNGDPLGLVRGCRCLQSVRRRADRSVDSRSTGQVGAEN